MAALFDLSINGPPPGDATVGTLHWIDLGVIPIGKRLFFGSTQYLSPDKSITFELRTNNLNESTGADSTTKLLASASVSIRAGLVTSDLYRKGRLHIVTVLGTGTERCWLKLKSKSGSAGSYMFTINYTLE